MKRYVVFLFFVILVFQSCGKDSNNLQPDSFVFPIGRSVPGVGKVRVFVGDSTYVPDVIYDSCGGYWLHFLKSELPAGSNIVVQITRKKEDLNLFKDIMYSQQSWIKPSYYIDSDNETLESKATELTVHLTTNVEKAIAIKQFVINHVMLNTYNNSFLDIASKTYDLGYGTCMNFSRLYVAMCRAVNIPARTVWGIVYDYNNNGIYDYHHQWAEILDENGYWHACDFSYTTDWDLNNIRYLDLIYAAEENTFVKNRVYETIMMKSLNYYNDYPVTLTARLGFELIKDARPDSMVVKYSIFL